MVLERQIESDNLDDKLLLVMEAFIADVNLYAIAISYISNIMSFSNYLKALAIIHVI